MVRPKNSSKVLSETIDLYKPLIHTRLQTIIELDTQLKSIEKISPFRNHSFLNKTENFFRIDSDGFGLAWDRFRNESE